MRLDKNLSPRQLWTIAADPSHRDADLLDAIVDHPATYRALSDWAVAALAEEDLSAVAPPPEPEPIAGSERQRGLRVPGVLLRNRRSAHNEIASADEDPEPPEVEEDEAKTPPPVNPWLTSNSTEASKGVDPWLTSTQSKREDAPKSAAREPVAKVASMPHSASNFLRRPAPLGLVIVLAVIEILTLLALAVVARDGASFAAALDQVPVSVTWEVRE
ncbi:hypothetical protein [Actinomyces trachealis]|uniref:hypothetical protein n=1 Tax=Actinomyces trachealis TaxID=2763540 RepID=UPI001892CFF3|nr:hypothetical protein [Actinomyces trachealis]